ncbi:MAG: Gfo/Idh/MocA family oxidoreductase [Bacteroidia bacterium]|nr:Gfo/Idh/MocA family oxidoreductase [Bacteroidia bacterium]
MTRIILLGVGNLGKRYIQAIARICNIDLFLYDISANAVQTVPEFLIPNGLKGLEYKIVSDFNQVLSLINENTLVIVATTSYGRADMLEKIICRIPGAIICEKPVAQKEKEYLKIMEPLAQNRILSFVDFTYRIQPFYQKIKSIITKKDGGILYINLPKTGLACAGIHQIDLFFWLFDLKSCTLINSSFSRTYEQKRAGYFDIVGSIELESGDFKCYINNSGEENLRTAQIILSDLVISVFEDQRIMGIVEKLNPQKITTEMLEYSFVSNYMTGIIQNIMKNNLSEINLPSIEESFNQHKILFDYLNKHSITDLNFT